MFACFAINCLFATAPIGLSYALADSGVTPHDFLSLGEHDASLCCEELASSIGELVGKDEDSKARALIKH